MPSKGKDPLESIFVGITGFVFGSIMSFFMGALRGNEYRATQQSHVLLPNRLERSRAGASVPRKLFNFRLRLSSRDTIVLVSVYGFTLLFILLCAFITGVTFRGAIGWLFSILYFPICLGIVTFFLFGLFFRGTKKFSNSALEPVWATKDGLRGVNYREVPSYTIKLPKTTKWDTERAGRFMEQLVVKFDAACFQIVAEADRITWRILDLRGYLEPAAVEQAIYSFYPDAIVSKANFATILPAAPFYRSIVAYQQVADFLLPITSVDALTDFDPLVNLTHEMDGLQPNESVTYTLYVSDRATFVYTQLDELLTVKAPSSSLGLLSPQGWAQAGFDLSVQEQNRLSKYDPTSEKVIERKMQNIIFQALLLVQIDAPTQERVESLIHLRSHLVQFMNLPYNALLVVDKGIFSMDSHETAWSTSIYSYLDKWLSGASFEWNNFRLLLDTRELASLWHLPHSGFTASSILWGSGKHVPIPADLRNAQGDIQLGTNLYANKANPVYMLDNDRLEHMSIIGATGVGKTTLMYRMIKQDIARGNGVAVIDPEGKLVQTLLQSAIPEDREDEVVLWDLSNNDYPPPLNPLAISDEAARSEAASYVQTVFDKIYGDDIQGKRMGNTFRMLLQTVMTDSTPTIWDIPRAYTDEEYRWQLLERLDDATARVVESFWERYDRMKVSEREHLIQPIEWRITDLVSNSLLYPILCHPQVLDIHSLISQNKIILISLHPSDRTQLDEHSLQLLGALWIGQFYMAVRAGAAPKPFFLYVDEAQDFVTSDIDKVLARARKNNMGLTLANQYLRQLEGAPLDAVVANTATRICFRCGVRDAKEFIPHMSSRFGADDLVSLDKFQAAIALQWDGQQIPAFSLQVENFSKDFRTPTDEMRAIEKRIRDKSVAQYTPKTHEQIMQWLSERYPRKRRPSDDGDEITYSEPLDK